VTAVSPRYYTIGFIEPAHPLAKSVGSGTLVSLRTLHGILTARHVVAGLRKLGLSEIGLAHSHSLTDAQPQRMLLPMPRIEEMMNIGSEPDSEFGADLAFIKLPNQTAETMKARFSFLNLLREAELLKLSAPDGTSQRDFVFGVVADWTVNEPDPSKGIETGLISILMNEGHTIEIKAHDGWDRLQFTPLPRQDFSPPLPKEKSFPPKTYGGTSGGGLWRRFVEPTTDGKGRFVQSRLLGVPYWEKPLGSPEVIICHGPDSIYRRLPEEIFNRWKENTA
jgi:hypothetical protein